MLWVVIGVAAVVLAALLVWGLVGRGETEPTESPTPSDPITTATGSEDPTDPVTESTDPGPDPTDEWGPVPPPNIDRLKDFSDPAFPETVGIFTLGGEPTVGGVSVIANYDDLEAFRTLLVTQVDGTDRFATGVARIGDPTIVGDAVCGVEADEPDFHLCVVAGSTATLEILGGTDVTVQELGEFATELVNLL